MEMTQCQRILRHLKDYGSITSVEAMREYGIMRLASRIRIYAAKVIPLLLKWQPEKIATKSLLVTQYID